ncbi:sorting nexin-2 isoform X1 [Procambarus clarkii]|uniref:sorting nexin-2 isoform X1 n=1 Tax=Procambarus clarkii TaxID=6728 RepID=UPI001E673A97|nr:sorting nexin-2-like isoform X1 [Procambarus clarkii]
MADSREPPPLFNDDDDSHKDDDTEDLFTSAVQSPVSEQTTPEDCRRQEGAGDPLTSSPPAASLTPDPPVGGHSDFFESSEEATEGGFSSVPLEHPAGGGGTQQELSSQLAPTLVDAPSVEPANMNSFNIPAEEANSLDAAPNATVKPAANGAILDDQSPNSNDDIVDAADSASKTTDAPTTQKLDTDPTSMHDALTFLGDGDTTEISLDDNTKEVSLEEEPDGALFESTSTPKLQLNQDPSDHSLPASSILPPVGVPITPPVVPMTPTTTPNLTPSITPAAPTPITPVTVSRPSPEQLESESGDEFIQVTISDPQKIGEGMSSYMAYKVTTKTNITYFRKKHWSVMRRFSDFLGLHRKLVEKHLHSGRIIPPAPEKSAIGTTKIKLSSDKSTDSASSDFIEKRRASLERYMNRTGSHPTLRADPDFREFIELDAELPRATQTSALSSAGVLRLFNRVGETVNKMTFKMDESDQWFEEKTQQIESLDSQLRKLHAAMEGLVAYRRELATSTAAFAKSAAVLSSVEEHSSLSRALHQLAESTERGQTIHHAQADADFYLLSETTKDYIQLIGAVKDVFHERVKTFQTWQHAQAMLAKKREAKAKAELAGRMDKVQQAQEEVAEWEVKVERSQEEFERISRAIKKEMEQFEVIRVKDFKDMIVKYLEALMTSQQQITKVWETFIPEAKAIS